MSWPSFKHDMGMRLTCLHTLTGWCQTHCPRCQLVRTMRGPAARPQTLISRAYSRPEIMVSLLSKVEEQYNIKITFSVETEPLGTGARMRFAYIDC